MEHWQVARGFDFLGASPYSPISDFGNNSSANRQLSIFISSCFSVVETIFSTAENHEDMEQDILSFIKELSWDEHGRREQSTSLFVSASFHFPPHDFRLKWRIYGFVQRTMSE